MKRFLRKSVDRLLTGSMESNIFSTYVPKKIKFHAVRRIAQLQFNDYVDNSILNNNIDLVALGIKVTVADFTAILYHLYTGINNCKTVMQFLDAIMVAVSRLLNLRPLQIFKLLGDYIINLFMNLFGDQIIGIAQSDFYIKTISKAQDFINNIRHFTNQATEKLNSEFSNKMTVFLSCILSLPVCLKYKIGSDWMGFSKVQVNAMRRERERSHALPFSIRCVDSFLYIVERILDCVKYKSLDRLSYDDKFILDYNQHFQWHAFYADKLDLVCNFPCVDVRTGVESEHKFTWKSYLANIETLMEMNKEIRVTTSDKALQGHLKIEMGVLERAKMRVLLKMEVCRTRDAPWAAAIIGAPSVGKTQIVDKILKIKGDIDKELGRNPFGYDPERRYNFNYRDKYMSGFTSSHTSIVLDDCGQFKSDLVAAIQGGPVMQLIDFINDNPLITEQAELENKGKIQFLCNEVMITSNFSDCGFDEVFKQQGGIYRRFLFILCQVREEYRVEGETRLKGDFDNPLNFDLHEFRMKRFTNNNGVNSPVFWHKDQREWVVDPNVPWCCLKELAYFLKDDILIPRYEQQDRARIAGDHFLGSSSCSTCKMTSLLCDCAKAQADAHYDSIHDLRGVERSETPDSTDTYIDENRDSWSNYFQRYFASFSMMCFSWMAFCFSFCNCESFALSVALKVVKWFNITFTRQDNDNSFLSHRRRRMNDYARTLIEKITGKDVLVSIINKNREDLLNAFNLTAIFSTLSIMIAMYSLSGIFTSDKKIAQAQASEEDGDDEDDYWEVKYQDMTKLDGVPSTTTMPQLLAAVERNIMMLKFQYKGAHTYVNVFGIYGNVAIIPKHSYEQLKERDFKCFITAYRNNKKQKFGATIQFMTLDETNFIVLDHNYDYVIVKSPTFGTFRDVRKFMLQDKMFVGKTEGILKGRDTEGELVTFEFKAFQSAPLRYVQSSRKALFEYFGYKAYAHRETFLGLCGAPYLVKTNNGCFIAGFHVALQKAFKNIEIYCCPLLQKDLHFETKSMVPLSYNGLDLNETYVTTQDLAISQELHEKCPVRNLKEGSSLLVYGSLDLFRPKLKSLVCHTVYCQDVLDYYGMLDVEYFSPKGVNSRNCLTMTVDKMCQKSHFPPAYIEEVKNSLLKIYLDVVRKNDIHVDPNVYPMSVAINGLDGVPYINRLPVKTSGGFAHKGRKDKYFKLGEATADHMVNYYLTDDIAAEVNTALDRIKKGERITAVWDFTFKDEPITAEKVRKDKCRLFNSASLFLSLLERQAFLWCIPLFSGKYRHKFGCAIGANAVGKDWTVLYNYIVRFGSDRVIAGDYSSFDKRMEPAIMTAAFEILIGLARNFGFPEEDILLMEAVATEVIYPITNVSGTIVEFYGTNPSGHSLTTIINSIVNCLYMMLACKDIAVEENMDINFDDFFDKHFSLVTYGDDNIATSNVDAFNHTRISKALGKYGVEYTMADKESESVPFIDISEASFLKRFFVKREDRFIRAPLDEKSIKKMLTVCTASRTITIEHQCAEIVESACREYFQYGRKSFEKHRQFLSKILDDYNLWGYLGVTSLPTYKQMHIICYDSDAIAQSDVEVSSEYSDISDDSNAYILDECIIFRDCCCIIHLQHLYRELDCDDCHCKYCHNCSTLFCPSDKENKITQV
jgi:hypothetical protein